ncbi:trehalose phosphatase [Geopseudomonas aromaticivorans]
MASNRPLVFVDLDDTLFQTARKMGSEDRHVATLDVHGNPNGYMRNTQKAFAEWLLASADVVPVTARSIEAYSRVSLPFTCGAICSHGGAMLRPDRRLDSDWHAQMREKLGNYQGRLHDLSRRTLEIGEQLGVSLRGWVVEEEGLATYVVTKHNEQTDEVLKRVLAEVQSRNLLLGLYIHGNGNNLAFIPNELSKRAAVLEWLRRDKALHGERPVIGFGDSISDLGFMGECHWWGTPQKGQLADLVWGSLK